MKIQDDDDLYVAIESARTLLRAVHNSMEDIDGCYDEHGWFIPKYEKDVCWKYCEWLEIIRSIFDKMDDAYTYLDEKLTPKEEEA